MEKRTTKSSQNTYEELLAITRSEAELRAQFVAVLENIERERAEIKKMLGEFRAELAGQGKETRERLERMERVIDATYLHVSHLAESAVAILGSDRKAYDALRAEIERKALDKLDQTGITIEAGKDINIKGDITEEKDEAKGRK